MQVELQSQPYRFKRVLVLNDLHAQAENVTWRGGLLARSHGAWLRILHLSRFGDPERALHRLKPTVWRLQEHLQVGVIAQAFRGSFSGELRAAAEDADLVVMRAPAGFDAATGLHPLRAAQLAARPVLVVRKPATSAYRRVIVAAGDPSDGQRWISTASAMSDGKEVPTLSMARSAAEVLERERTLYPDVVVVPCAAAPSLARRFLALTEVDTLLIPAAPETIRQRAVRSALVPRAIT